MTTKNRASFFLVLLVGFITTIGCAPIHTTAPNFEQKKPHSIAILPVLNETLDLDAPKTVQPLVHRYMLSKGYELLDEQETKLLLAKKNIHEAGQIFSLTYPELGKLLGADALLFCTVTDWTSLYLLVYSSVVVETKFELIEAKTGQRLWEAQYKSRKIASVFLGSSAEETLKVAAFSPYEPRAETAVRKCLSTLPNGPYYVGRKRQGCLGP